MGRRSRNIGPWKPRTEATDSELDTKQTGHAECQDDKVEMMKQISLEAPEPAAMDVEDESPADHAPPLAPKPKAIP
ncbi:hypothetical protein Tsubulata_042977 [Turnera subulata]|uniref:Uncharacterized protein n=1 Tax=Turnera subulata TaxID=218843 RepID=A0A9Q0GCT3_9ROSI|nr:hypothetical protein Tsubulata_042977 [Turnera subulata]